MNAPTPTQPTQSAAWSPTDQPYAGQPSGGQPAPVQPSGAPRSAPPPPPQGYGPHPRQPMPAPPPRSSRLPSAAEALGWGGAATTLLGILTVTADYWTTLSAPILLAMLAVASGVLGLAGLVVGNLAEEDGDSLATNLSTALWWAAGLGTVITSYVAGDLVGDGDGYLAALAAGLTATALTATVAQRRRTDGYVAATILSAAVSGFALGGVLDLDEAGILTCGGAVAVAAAVALMSTPGLFKISYGTTLVLIAGWAAGILGGDASDVAVVVTGVVLVALAVGAGLRRSPAEAVWTGLVAGIYALQVAYEVAPGLFSIPALVLVAGVSMTLGCIALVRRVR